MPFIKQNILAMFVEAFRVSVHKIPEHFTFPRSDHYKHLTFLAVGSNKQIPHHIVVIHGIPYFIWVFKRIKSEKNVALTGINV